LDVSTFINGLLESGVTFFCGVPDSQLKPFCDKLNCGDYNHITAHNEGGAVALAAGYHIATGKVGCVYMQNSGLGNAVNPITSLMSGEVYGIPALYVIGWRGEPGVKDEPQHVHQGRITLPLLEVLDLKSFVFGKNTSESEFKSFMNQALALFAEGKGAAIVVEKGALSSPEATHYANNFDFCREEAVNQVLDFAGDDIIVSTTGKISREVFETRESKSQGHGHDFLTVGSMGHSSMISLGLALNTDRRLWCLDGDGAILMHQGSLETVAHQKPKNLIHVVLNNTAHESVGGMPVAEVESDYSSMAKIAGYLNAYTATNANQLDKILKTVIHQQGPSFIEVKVSIGSRDNLGRPTTTPKQNKEELMRFLNGGKA